MCTFWTLCGHVCEPNLSWKVVENEFDESWKTLEFGLCKSWKVLENGILLSVRTLLKVAHVTPTHHAHVHQVTACCLHVLMKKSYLQYTEMEPELGNVKTFEQLCVE